MTTGKTEPNGGTGEGTRSPVGDEVVCVLCGHGKRGVVTEFRMTHGVAVWLCPVHGAPDYLRRRKGRTFVERLAAIWRAAGSFTQKRAAALEGHRARMIGPANGDLPGSYSWPDLRREAEARFAAGDDPVEVIRDLRERFAAWPARVPSVRTMRRWHAEGRWFTAKPKGPRRKILGIPRPLASNWEGIIPFHWASWILITKWWIDDRPKYHWREWPVP